MSLVEKNEFNGRFEFSDTTKIGILVCLIISVSVSGSVAVNFDMTFETVLITLGCFGFCVSIAALVFLCRCLLLAVCGLGAILFLWR